MAEDLAGYLAASAVSGSGRNGRSGCGSLPRDNECSEAFAAQAGEAYGSASENSAVLDHLPSRGLAVDSPTSPPPVDQRTASAPPCASPGRVPRSPTPSTRPSAPRSARGLDQEQSATSNLGCLRRCSDVPSRAMSAGPCRLIGPLRFANSPPERAQRPEADEPAPRHGSSRRTHEAPPPDAPCA